MLTALLAILPLLPAVAAQRSLLLTSDALPEALPECLQTAYYGRYGGQHAFLPSSECLASSLTGQFDTGTIAPVDEANQLVWVGPSLPGSLSELQLLDAWIEMEEAAGQVATETTQTTFGTSSPFVAPQLVGISDHGMVLSIEPSTLPLLDTILPPTLVPVGFASAPLPLVGDAYPVPKHYAENLAKVIKDLRFNPALNKITTSLDAKRVQKDVRWLTGEDGSGWHSRHSFTQGARDAGKWVKAEVEATGAKCELFDYLPGFAPNVICKYRARGESETNVVLSGHLDSRGSFGSLVAPGADDDASGSAHVLAVARAIGEHNVTFEHPVTLAFFTGEEQGLFGSHYYAKHLKESNASVALHIQTDMLAYHAPGEPMQLALPETIELAEASWLVANVSALYAPELVVGRTPACCSDHQSFLEYGFPATHVFERNGWIADPMYHNSGDVSEREGYDFEQIVSIAKVTLGSIFEVAGWKKE